MRLVDLRLLEGPNVYRLEPTVKIEVVIGRRRSWYGDRMPGRHAIVRLGEALPRSAAPERVRSLASWVELLHIAANAGGWLRAEGRRALPVTIHRTSEPGHWIVAFPWRERERAERLADASFRLAEGGLTPEAASPARIARVAAAIAAAGTSPPLWIRDEARRLPAISISGTNGKSTTTRMLTHILVRAGRRVGTTTSDGVLIDEQLVEEGDLTGPGGARAVLTRDDLDVAVLETARGGMVLKGVGYESNDAAVLTNVTADHLDLHGLHTLPELAEVKSVIARMTRPDGTVVLNADDPLVAAVGRRVRARVWLFSIRPAEPRVRRHLARGGRAFLLQDGQLVQADGAERTPILPAADAPATLFGTARHNVANALAAAAGARALGASVEQVADGLRDFRPSAELAPGRLNLFLLDERVVIVDFAHNEAGVSVLLDVAEALAGPRDRRRIPLGIVVGTAGDRPDDAVRGIGRIAGARADHVAIKETVRYLRGRSRESALGELLAGVTEGSGRRGDVPIYPDEPSALEGELSDPSRPGGTVGRPFVLVVLCHAEREQVLSTVERLGARPAASDELRRLLSAAV